MLYHESTNDDRPDAEPEPPEEAELGTNENPCRNYAELWEALNTKNLRRLGELLHNEDEPRWDESDEGDRQYDLLIEKGL